MDLDALNVVGLSTACQEQSNLYFARQSFDPKYCYELFRRAIVSQSDEAWTAVYQQYTPLVKSWIHKNSLWQSQQAAHDIDEVVNRVFAKMWRCISIEKFTSFADLASLLRYLQMCVHSELVDIGRVAARHTAVLESETLFADAESDVPSEEYQAHQTSASAEQEVTTAAQKDALWHLVSAKLNSDAERIVFYETFVLWQKPRQIAAGHTDIFRNTKEVSRVKDNLIARLRRDRELHQSLIDLSL